MGAATSGVIWGTERTGRHETYRTAEHTSLLPLVSTYEITLLTPHLPASAVHVRRVTCCEHWSLSRSQRWKQDSLAFLCEYQNTTPPPPTPQGAMQAEYTKTSAA